MELLEVQGCQSYKTVPDSSAEDVRRQSATKTINLSLSLSLSLSHAQIAIAIAIDMPNSSVVSSGSPSSFADRRSWPLVLAGLPLTLHRFQ
jgi:hypothetical protein